MLLRRRLVHHDDIFTILATGGRRPRAQHLFNDLRSFLDDILWQLWFGLRMVEIFEFVCLLPRKLYVPLSASVAQCHAKDLTFTTLSGKLASSATWIPNDWSHTPA